MKQLQLNSRNWFGKACAGLVLGFFLALGLSGLFAVIGPGEIGNFSARHQLTMWMIAPLMVAILSGCFMFHTGLRAWCWLGLANLITWGFLYAVNI